MFSVHIAGAGASMRRKQIIIDTLSADYGGVSLLDYVESDGEIRFRTSTPLTDRQTVEFRSRMAALNQLAISHRLSLALGRDKYELPDEFAFAIKSLETTTSRIGVVDNHEISLRFDIISTQRDVISALKSTLTLKSGAELRKTVASFSVLPPALVNFVRRGRHFMDFPVVKMSREKSELAAVDENHLRYYPSESDRLSDGRRVDHVPALTLIDIALDIKRAAHGTAGDRNIYAVFSNYADPRIAFDVFLNREQEAVEFVQNGQVAAVIRDFGSPAQD